MSERGYSMENILHKLYRGEISPADGYEARWEEYQQMRQKHILEYDAFVQSLEPRQQKAFNRIMNHQFDTIPMEYADTFVEGFEMGVKMVVAVFQKEILGSI